MLFLPKIPVALFALSLLADSACAKETIAWGRFNTAPNMTIERSDKDQGTFDQVRAVLEKRHYIYHHKQVIAPFPRIFHGMKNGSGWCSVGGSNSAARQQFARFSVPAVITQPHNVSVRQADLQRLGIGPVSLERLLTSPRLCTFTV